MKLHLPVRLFKSILSCFATIFCFTAASGIAWAEEQDLTFNGSTLTWDTNAENKVFTNAAGESASFVTGDNVTFASDASVSLGEDISAGQINIASGADVVIELADNGLSFDTLSMQGGSLDAGDSLNIAAGETLAVGSNGSVLKSALILGNDAHFSVDYSGTGSATSLNKSALSLQGGTRLQLSGCGNGDGKTYTLLTGVSTLLNAQGNAIALDSSNNAIANYFDTSQPGTGFWANATLQLTEDGALQLVRHSETVSDPVKICTPSITSLSLQYHKGVAFLTNVASDEIVLHDNGSVLLKREWGTDDLLGYVDYQVDSADPGYHVYHPEANPGLPAMQGNRLISLNNNGRIEFSGHTVMTEDYKDVYGSAIYGADSCKIELNNNNVVVFSGNAAMAHSSYYDCGGAIYGNSISLNNNGSVEFSGNTADSEDGSAFGGAIYGNSISLSNNGSVTFRGNTVSSTGYDLCVGGAIYGSAISLDNNGSVEFSENSSSGGGGAIRGENTIELINNNSVAFNGNTALGANESHAFGGAIYGKSISLSNNGSVTFSGNTASGSSSACGGAIAGDTITLSDNGSVEFSGNSSSDDGGAIRGGTIELINNNSVAFNGNTALGANESNAFGGAIYSSVIILKDNGSVVFDGNTASCTTDAYHCGASGGAIYGQDTIELINNGSVVFNGNTASSSNAIADGGAIEARGKLSICNNDSVYFEKNVEISRSSYRLRSIYAYGGSDSEISLSAAAGKSIEFRDSVHIGSGNTVKLNADCTYQNVDGESVTVKQVGDIIFTGKYAETHLNEILAADEQGRTATTEEIRNSRTTEVYALTNLHGGRLRVEDGAIYEGYGITAHEGSAATVRVKDATLNHAAYELHFFEGTTLETLGESAILGDVIVESTATASFSALTRLEGSLTLASGSALNLEGEITLDGALMLGTSITLGGNMLDLLNQLQEGQSLTLISGLESFTIQTPNLVAEGEYTVNINEQELRAADYFSNLNPNLDLVLTYNAELGALSVIHVIPEPTTTTLSLLALTALLARRRRK